MLLTDLVTKRNLLPAETFYRSLVTPLQLCSEVVEVKFVQKESYLYQCRKAKHWLTSKAVT